MSRAWLAVLLFVVPAACTMPQSAAPDRAAPPVQPRQSAAAAPAPLSPTGAASVPARPDFVIEGALEQGGWLRGQVPSGTVSAMLGKTPLAFDKAGRFFAAFDRDEGTAVSLVATRADGTQVSRPLTIKPRAWAIEHVDAPRRPAVSTAAFLARRLPELEAIGTARQKDTGAQGWAQTFAWPASGRISGRFGAQRIYRGEPSSYHSGLDIAGGDGAIYRAPADGVVVLAAADFSLEGKLLIIDHGQGLNSAFLHSRELFVREGETVRQGDPLGRIGASGRTTGPHLHWSLMWRTARLDPLLFLPPQP